MHGSGSLIQESNSPLALMGPLGTTTWQQNTKTEAKIKEQSNSQMIELIRGYSSSINIHITSNTCCTEVIQLAYYKILRGPSILKKISKLMTISSLISKIYLKWNLECLQFESPLNAKKYSYMSLRIFHIVKDCGKILSKKVHVLAILSVIYFHIGTFSPGVWAK